LVIFLSQCSYFFLRLIKPAAIEPNPSRPSNGSGDAVCGSFWPAFALWSAAVAFWSAAVAFLSADGAFCSPAVLEGAAFWSGVVLLAGGFWAVVLLLGAAAF
jgi:hypothetical protein